MVKKLHETQEMWVRSLGQEDTLEEATATDFSIFVWKIPRTEEPGGLQSIGSQSQTRLSNETTATRNIIKILEKQVSNLVIK